MEVSLFQPSDAHSRRSGGGGGGGSGGKRGGGGGGGKRGGRTARAFTGTANAAGGVPGQCCYECGSTNVRRPRAGGAGLPCLRAAVR